MRDGKGREVRAGRGRDGLVRWLPAADSPVQPDADVGGGMPKSYTHPLAFLLNGHPVLRQSAALHAQPM